MLHPDTELRFISDAVGFGIVATRRIPRGTITWVRDRLDQSFSLDQVVALPPVYREILDKYSFVDAHGQFVLCWDHARFLNHSCDPTCRGGGYEFELAVRDIQVGEELTDDYGSLNLEADFACACGAPHCRRTIRPDDLVRFADAWDRSIVAPFRAIRTVAQPLWPFLPDPAQVDRATAGVDLIASVRQHYFDVTQLATRLTPMR